MLSGLALDLKSRPWVSFVALVFAICLQLQISMICEPTLCLREGGDQNLLTYSLSKGGVGDQRLLADSLSEGGAADGRTEGRAD